MAARYLDLSKIPADERKTSGPELAKQLADILNKEPRFEVDQLSDDPAGYINDGLTPNTEVLLKLNGNDETAALLLERIQQQGVDIWLVAPESVARIADIDALEGASKIEKHMPTFLVRHKILGTAWWAWISLIVLTLLLFVFSNLLSRLFLFILTPVVKRFAKTLQSYRLATLTDPLRLLISLSVFRAVMELVTPSALLRDYLIKLLIFFFTLGLAMLAMRIVDLISAQILGRLEPSERTLSYSVLPLGARVIRICIFLIAVILILASWGYNTNALLAGLGVGGLAVALAAQKTLENLFGAISLISDRPVLVGDVCKFGDQTGTVEDIGLRSTRIRTPDRTVVTIPNSAFSAMTLENFSRRDRIWFHPTVRVRRDTNPGKVQEMMDALEEILRNHPLVQPAEVPVRFSKITDYSLDLEIFAYVATADYNEFLKTQTALLLKFLEASQQHGVGWALPISESVTVNPPAADPPANSNFHPAVEPPAVLPPPG
jgi:MscS family membrane protein